MMVEKNKESRQIEKQSEANIFRQKVMRFKNNSILLRPTSKANLSNTILF